ncbi:MAG TPA: P63C domain-containing protein [Acetobacteraceae bacterium]|nr:P63C domain-containing protein [Acetobacteraceae bacterium]
MEGIRGEKPEPKGRARGGQARADKLTPAARADIAKKAAAARWHGPALRATHGSDDHPLKIGEIEIPCYVLEDGTRVLSQRGVVGGLGMRYGSRVGGADRLTGFLSGSRISPFVSSELLALIGNPIRFRHPGGGNLAFGYPATILADICDAVLAARKAGALQKQQEHIADQSETLVRGFARVGIIALVDEATGYQRDRAKDALEKILAAFITKELQPYVPTFPSEYYEQIFRLRGLDYPTGSVKRPQYFGVLTNDIVYKRLAPGVLEELKKITPRSESGLHKDRLFQRLTSNKGYPKLRELLGSVVTIMSFSQDWHDFMAKLNHRHPRYDDQMRLPLDYQPDADQGTGL